MKKQKIRVILLASALAAFAGSLLIAQSSQAQKDNKTTTKEAKATETHNGRHPGHQPAKPGPVPHPFGPTTIHVNVAACELQEPMVHADPEANHGKVFFEQINGTNDVSLTISNNVLKQSQVTVPAHGQVPVDVNGDAGYGYINFATPCTRQHVNRGKGQHILNDPNEILVP